MSPTEAARRLVGLEGFHWADGMRVHENAVPGMSLYRGGALRIMDADEHVPHAATPDLEDDATRGIVLGMLSRRVGAYCWIALDDALLSYWSCLSANTDGGHSPLADGSSWAEAFVRAWEATPPHA